MALLIGDRDHPLDAKRYFLFNSRLDSIVPHQRIDKRTPEHRELLRLIGDWLDESGVRPDEIQDMDNRLDDFLQTLHEENY